MHYSHGLGWRNLVLDGPLTENPVLQASPSFFDPSYLQLRHAYGMLFKLKMSPRPILLQVCTNCRRSTSSCSKPFEAKLERVLENHSSSDFTLATDISGCSSCSTH
ncbi:hypothetical protein MIND_01007000 [Mycena indigotica]|uniref:Uncharacterized protein n=1 Tax=Mycena indigotica TaxID=2126181 RepID=A0A8H6S9A3_9AGAR|nr:uncharacterized protein MIND_01007000 [Mycena indigotica]KAF7294698.1 hypothetical protein MIND_01007000 [Mycena indigotica]